MTDSPFSSLGQSANDSVKQRSYLGRPVQRPLFAVSEYIYLVSRQGGIDSDPEHDSQQVATLDDTAELFRLNREYLRTRAREPCTTALFACPFWYNLGAVYRFLLDTMHCALARNRVRGAPPVELPSADMD